MSTKPKVLVVLTSHAKVGNSDTVSGWYLPELAHPWHELYLHADIVVVSPSGGIAPLDPASIENYKNDEVCVKFMQEQSALWKETEKIESYLGKADEFDAIFYVGGHGPMFDLAQLDVSHKILNEFYAKGKIISAVCHGPAALAYVKVGDDYLLAGQAVTGFSNTEEDAMGLSSEMPFSLEDELNRASSGKFEKAAKPWDPHVVVSGKFITGQNPASATGVGKALVAALK